MIALGLGWGFGYPALNVRATGGVADREQGLAAGLFNTGVQIGGAIGVAIASAIITSHIASRPGRLARRRLEQGHVAVMRSAREALRAAA